MLNLTNLKDEPVQIDPIMVRGFWSNHKGGTVLLVHSSLIKLFHPVSWRDEERDACLASLAKLPPVVPCMLDHLKGNKVVDVEVVDYQVLVEVAQSPTLIRDMLEGAMPAKSAK